MGDEKGRRKGKTKREDEYEECLTISSELTMSEVFLWLELRLQPVLVSANRLKPGLQHQDVRAGRRCYGRRGDGRGEFSRGCPRSSRSFSISPSSLWIRRSWSEFRAAL